MSALPKYEPKRGPFYQPWTVGDVDRMKLIRAHPRWSVGKIAAWLQRQGLGCSLEHLLALYAECRMKPLYRGDDE